MLFINKFQQEMLNRYTFYEEMLRYTVYIYTGDIIIKKMGKMVSVSPEELFNGLLSPVL